MTTADAQAALLTPWGRGGLAVLLLSGAGTARILRQCFRPRAVPVEADLPVARPLLGQVSDADGQVIDEVILTFDPRRRWAELSCHGGTRVVQRLAARFQELGAVYLSGSAAAELAWPDLDRLQAEAMCLLPQAATRFVVSWLSGQATTGLARALREAIGMVDRGRLPDAAALLETIRSTWPAAKRLLDPAAIVLVGPPNAGKSTLANALSGRERSIVTEVPGTTRDWVEHPVALDGVPVTVIDTAGTRPTTDPLEIEALSRSRQQRLHADLVLVVLDATRDLQAQMQALPESIDFGSAVVAINKCDLCAAGSGPVGLKAIRISALRGDGLDGLSAVLRRRLGVQDLRADRPAVFTAAQAMAIDAVLDALRKERAAAARAGLAAILTRAPTGS